MAARAVGLFETVTNPAKVLAYPDSITRSATAVAAAAAIRPDLVEAKTTGTRTKPRTNAGAAKRVL